MIWGYPEIQETFISHMNQPADSIIFAKSLHVRGAVSPCQWVPALEPSLAPSVPAREDEERNKRIAGLIYPIPSGYVKIAIENGPVEIVSFSIRHGDFPVRYVKLPEGKSP